MNLMTLSEVDHVAATSAAGSLEHALALLALKQAATIRELEARDARRIEAHQETLERERAALEKLKIATEALNGAAGVLSGERMTKGALVSALEKVAQALARMKEGAA